ncbi:repressor LexA [Corynebacterium sp. HMSC056E09]|uniref:transcriptional repressor LexA n=1 Tax=Corynebacterium TaxID=1716 RepID=UPI0008A3EA0B|nr:MULTISPECIES: transcriptional repressor LexA [Corynebacterium]MBE7339111.1 transcriptional repressor LexA [Corynebacterium aurimucosum]MCZ9297463.1 transcriptional repressor LexA [Corynebacterium hesseae]MTD98123.1 transcriptional repressor LexA [Corynebacterium guaraldiae]OFQ91117.1 repressor LexA [Corynebacterium sp. HMSC056E09]HCT9180135.1 transcriptional repressor LexA [Corynebacterium aurimucosum]
MARNPKRSDHPSLDSLSPRQRRILEVIHDAVMLRGYPPSIREIGDATGLQSTSSVAYQLKQLEEKGFLRRDPNKPRAVDVRHFPGADDPKKPGRKTGQTIAPSGTSTPDAPEDAATPNYIPVVGRIAAGSPITAEENIDAYFPMPGEILGSGELYMLQVVGDSMQDAGILNGDWVIIRSQSVAEEGEFVAALLDGEEATVKEFHRDSSGVWLLPHNDAYSPIKGDEAEIMGKVVSVFRKL